MPAVMAKLICKEVIRSHLREVHDLTARLLGEAEEHGFNDGALKDLRVAIDEAIANAVIHGNANKPRKQIKVRCYLHDHGTLEIRVKDEGPGFDANRIPDPTRHENLLSTHGRGIFLIRQYMDRVTFNRRGNEIRMWKRRSA
jgi:serine/threonine-protein kinase RsbW